MPVAVFEPYAVCSPGQLEALLYVACGVSSNDQDLRWSGFGPGRTPLYFYLRSFRHHYLFHP